MKSGGTQTATKQNTDQKMANNKRAQITKIKEYYANVKPKVFTNYDHKNRQLI